MILQSYKLTTIRDKFGLHAQRLIVNIASQMQYRIEGTKFSKPVTNTYRPTTEEREFKVNVRDLMTEGDNKNTALIKNILDETIKAYISYDRINEKGEKEWVRTTFFEEIYWTLGKSEIGVKITESMWYIFAEFSKGFRKYELDCAMKLKSTYSLRLYQLISNVESPIEYKIEELRLMFGLDPKKYTRTFDFIKKVIEPAKAELDKRAPWTFKYKALEEETEGKRGKKKIDRILFLPHKNSKFEDSELEYKNIIHRESGYLISSHLRRLLKDKFEFTDTEIKNNIELFMNAENRLSDITAMLRERAPEALRKNNPKGWIINLLRYKLSE